MIRYSTESIFDSGCDVLVNPVNCVGVMGGGLALAFAHRFPVMVPLYEKACAEGRLVPGRSHYYVGLSNYPTICNFPTKIHWKDKSKLPWIAYGLEDLKDFLSTESSGTSVAIPALGCGLGGLPWEPVKELIEYHFKYTTYNVVVFPPRGREIDPAEQNFCGCYVEHSDDMSKLAKPGEVCVVCGLVREKR